VLLVTAFILVETVGMEAKLVRVFEDPTQNIARFRRATEQVVRYILYKTGANLLTGLLVWGWLAVWRVDFALLWGLGAFLLNYIPTLGSTLLAVPVVFVSLMQFGVGESTVIALGYLIINMSVAALLEPKVFGKALGLSTVHRFIYVTTPIAIRLAIPAYSNDCVSMLKATALASTVTLLDITGVARTIVAKTFAPYEIFIAAAIIYLSLTWLFQRGFGLLEARMSRYVKKEA